ncbi:Prp18-domain-containing protein [Auriculariales sp. MPI-PUGE-AT-0066]|nr:Prp18-domain-containing protein [Auriculariales sp. MPI-PUGE-AT-0066]
MDFLKGEIANKRKAIDDDVHQRPSKYMRRGEVEKLRAEEERRKSEEAAAASKAKSLTQMEHSSLKPSSSKLADARSKSSTPVPASSTPNAAATPDLSTAEIDAAATDKFNISNEDAIRRLRQKGQPIRLFGETDKERRLRLRALELIEERGGAKDRGAQQNDFKKALEDVERNERMKADRAEAADGAGSDQQREEEVLDMTLVKTDPDKLYPIIYFALKKKLKEWQEELDKRPENIKRSGQGIRAAATQVQAAESLKPFFKILRSRSLPPDMLLRISEIVHYMQLRQYQRANDSYLRLSIGNAAWPIGVTMVGIHERSAREKISTDQVAHVLNDEVSRKYIQSIKRILTFAQTIYPPEDLTQLMG